MLAPVIPTRPDFVIVPVTPNRHYENKETNSFKTNIEFSGDWRILAGTAAAAMLLIRLARADYLCSSTRPSAGWNPATLSLPMPAPDVFCWHFML